MTTDLFAHDLFAADLAAVVHPRAERRAHAPADLLTTHEHIGFELGWDHAHHGVTPAAPYAQAPSPLRHGWMAGQATFGRRTLTPTPAVRQWLQLRLHAWLRGRHVELFQITPHHLQRLAVSHCPITREALDRPADDARRASFDRVRHDAGYAAGNLVVMSVRANVAKAAHGFDSAIGIARRLDADRARGHAAPPTHDGPTAAAHGSCAGLTAATHGSCAVLTAAQHGSCAGLTAAQWGRVAVLCSFVEPLPHARAAELPLLVLPPNRLRLFNPVQALQAFISQQLLKPGWSQRINAIEALLPGAPARRAFRSFFQTWLPRVLEAGRPTDPQHARWAIEDAWRHAPVMQRWVRFASLLSAAQSESLLSRAVVERLLPEGLRVEPLTDADATEGWCLETRGYVPHGMSCERRSGPASDSHTLH